MKIQIFEKDIFNILLESGNIKDQRQNIISECSILKKQIYIILI